MLSSKNKDVTILSLNHPDYPPQLKEIYDPPPVLYVRGNAKILRKPQIAIVGSRDASAQGLQCAKKFAAELSEVGFTITSGMALGIDGASHAGALQSKGKTVAVLGNGVDIIYPRQHSNLAEAIINQGCLVSEFPLGSPPTPYNFPKRNRIISGLSVGVLIVEAAQKSGSLITAQFALDQGREVFAIPGSINNPRTRGCHDLIRNGAKLVECISDILDELALLLQPDFRGRKATVGLSGEVRKTLSRDQQLLLSYIDGEPTCPDKIVAQTGLATSEVLSLLLELELKGLITAVVGGYSRTGSQVN